MSTSTVDERVETASQVLHERRHPLNRAATCDRCRADAQALRPLFTRSVEAINR